MLGRITSIALTASAASLTATQSTYSQRRQHFGAQFGVEDRSARTLVDEAVGGNGNDQHVAEPARGFKMAHMAEMQEIERPVRLHDGLAELAKLPAICATSSKVRTLSRGPAAGALGREVQFGDAGVQ